MPPTFNKVKGNKTDFLHSRFIPTWYLQSKYTTIKDLMQSLFQAVERLFRVDECPFHVVERRFNDGDYRKQRVILVYAP